MKVLLILQFFLLSASIPAKILIISDFDDTIKRSNIVDRSIRTLGNSLLSYKPYYDIPSLYIEMEKLSNGLYVLSASPTALRPLIKWTLKSYNIPYQDIFTRRLSEIGSDERKINYKINRIESVLKSNSDKVILLGDNVEADHLIYMKIDEKNPGRVAQIYIRRVIPGRLPFGVVGFFSAYEIAAHEYSAGRLSLAQVKKVARVILNTSQEEFYKIIPYYGICPRDIREFNLPVSSSLVYIEVAIVTKIIQYCAERD